MCPYSGSQSELVVSVYMFSCSALAVFYVSAFFPSTISYIFFSLHFSICACLNLSYDFPLLHWKVDDISCEFYSLFSGTVEWKRFAFAFWKLPPLPVLVEYVFHLGSRVRNGPGHKCIWAMIGEVVNAINTLKIPQFMAAHTILLLRLGLG